MKLTFIILSSLLIGSALSAHNCTSFNPEYHGFGCELKNVKPEDEIFEINVMIRHNESNKTHDDITWVQILDSQLFNLPKGIFERFVNLDAMIIESTNGFQILNTPYFNKRISFILFENTDIEVVGENPFVGLSELRTLSLNFNQITRVHKDAFRDLVKMVHIEMVGNQIEYLNEDIFRNNVNLKAVLLYQNKIKVISSQLFGRNKLLEWIQLQNNSITQIEKGFNKPLEELTTLDLSSNICIDKLFFVSSQGQWTSQQIKFKDCFHNYALMKSTNDVINKVREKWAEMEDKVTDMSQRIHNDLAVLEGKMNSSELDDFKTNLLKFFNIYKGNVETKYKNNLTSILLEWRTEMIAEIEKKVVIELDKTEQIKIIPEYFETFRDNFSRRFTFIYLMLFVFVVFVGAVVFGMFKYVRANKAQNYPQA